ncbi:MAG: hypothetical protein N3G80_04245 [Candidatus Micrarchaeota archaeon]|nr:hypothetical protein [Candidatus Micrarchaeota archaeon]
MRTLRLVFLIFLALSSILFASQQPTQKLKDALQQLCVGVRDLIPVAAMTMVLLAAVIYATGQMMGAETRARANVWATSCLTGALIGILIAVIAPSILTNLAPPGTQVNC